MVTRVRDSSFFQRIRYRLREFLTPEKRAQLAQEAEEISRYGTASIKVKLQEQSVSSTVRMAEALRNVVECLEPFDNAAVLVGNLIVVKRTDETGKTKLTSQSTSTTIKNVLEDNPHILDNLQELEQLLQ